MKNPTRKYDKYDRVPHEKSLTNFPTEILDIVVSHLPLPSKVCLALGCKGLYQLYSSVLKAKELHFPRASQNGRWYITTEEYHHRMTLLLQLENHHWACCGRCQKLHPRQEFPSFELQDPPYKRKCMPWAGILDLCPCVALTIRDRKHVVDYLTWTGGHEPISAKKANIFINKGLMTDSVDHNNRLSLLHKCNAYPLFRVEVRLSLTETGQLLAYARYDPLAGITSARFQDTVDICPHKTLSCCAARLFYDCAFCNAHSTTTRKNSGMKIVHVTRFLGRERWFGDSTSAMSSWSTDFDYQWYLQCRGRTDYMPL